MTEYVKVNTVSIFRQTYVIPVEELQKENTEIDILQDPAKQIEWAEDTVSTESADEFSQKWLGETITDTEILTKEQVLKLFDRDNPLPATEWDEERKLKFIHRKNPSK
jgi:hypothetical protein